MGYSRYNKTHRDCNMAGVRKLSSAFSSTTINNKTPALRVYNLGRLRCQQSFAMKHFGRYYSLDIFDKKKVYLELETRNPGQ